MGIVAGRTLAVGSFVSYNTIQVRSVSLVCRSPAGQRINREGSWGTEDKGPMRGLSWGRGLTHPDSGTQNMSVAATEKEMRGPLLLELLSRGSSCKVVSSLSTGAFKQRLEQHQGYNRVPVLS